MKRLPPFVLFPALLLALDAAAQVPEPVITDHVTYDTWKTQFITPGEPAVDDCPQGAAHQKKITQRLVR